MQLASDCEGLCSFGPFRVSNIDELVTSLERLFSVIPAKAGIQLIQNVLDPGVRRGDDQRDFLRLRQHWKFRISDLFGIWLLAIGISPNHGFPGLAEPLRLLHQKWRV